MTKNKKLKSTLNKYHQKRNKEAIKAVAEMMKKPKTYEEMRRVIHRSLYDEEVD